MSIDASTIKQAASGRWPEILSSLGGIDSALLDGRNHPCPRCGGTNRFRFIDAGAGSCYCNQCFNKANGDGLAALAWLHGWSFPEAVKQLAGYLGMNGNGRADRALGWGSTIGPEPIGSTRPEKPTAKPRIAKSYGYRDEHGELVFQVCRMEPKSFRQRRPKPGGGWTWSVKGVRAVPYRLPEFMAEPSRWVVVVEGEKDADALRAVGLLATCNAGGACKWTQEHAQHLAGRRVAIIGDNDEPGRQHALSVAASLYGVASSVRVVELPGIPDKGDVSDWLAMGNGKPELVELIKGTPEWTPGAQPWPELKPFDKAELPQFPVGALAGELRPWVESEAEATQTPPALAALLSLAACSACIARRVEVSPRPGWTEPVNIYAAVLLDPGNRKSAVFADCLAPLRTIEAELIEQARPSVSKAQSERRRMESRLKRAEKLASEKGDLEAAHEADKLAEELAVLPEAVLPRLLVDDATSEKLGAMLAEQDGRLASMSPEGGVFDLMTGAYKDGRVDFVTYLKAHSGDDLLTDRITRESVRVERPALTCCYTIQPEVIRGLAEQAAFRGRGLLARFCYALPPSPVGRRKVNAQPVAESIRGGYHATVRRLFQSFEYSEDSSRRFDQFANDFGGSSEDIEDSSRQFILRLDGDAAGRMIDWEQRIEDSLDDGGDMEGMRDWGSKLAGLTLRLAGVLHCCQHGPAGSIDADTLAAAIEIAQWSIPHAEATLGLMSAGESSQDADARYLLKWIEQRGLREFSRRDAHQHGRRRFKTVDDLEPVLKELKQRGFIRPQPADPSGPGRPPSPSYDVNPAVFERPGNRTQYTQNPSAAQKPENRTAEKRTQYTQNPSATPEGQSFEDIEDSFPASENTNTEREVFEI